MHPKDATGTNNVVADTDAVETSAAIPTGGIVAGIEYFVAGTPGSQINYPSVGLVRAGQSFRGTAGNTTYTVPIAGARVVHHYAVRIDCLTGRAKLVQPEIP